MQVHLSSAKVKVTCKIVQPSDCKMISSINCQVYFNTVVFPTFLQHKLNNSNSDLWFSFNRLIFSKRSLQFGPCAPIVFKEIQLKGSVKEPNMCHNYETEKITRKASDVAENLQLYRVVRFFHPRSSCMTHLMLFSEHPPIYASCMTISGGRTKQRYNSRLEDVDIRSVY